jgi:hypothetical protein
VAEMRALTMGGKRKEQAGGQWEQSSHNEWFKGTKVRNYRQLKNPFAQ